MEGGGEGDLLVDITGRAIKRCEPGSGRVDQWSVPGMPAAMVPRTKGGMIVAIDRHVALFAFGDRLEPFVVPETDLPGIRLNEAAADTQGRLWVRSMENNIAHDGSPSSIIRKKGALHVIEASGACRRAGEHRDGITNTLVWSGRTFITTDTLEGELYAFDYDDASGLIENRRLFSAEPGNPDGPCLDRKGQITT